MTINIDLVVILQGITILLTVAGVTGVFRLAAKVSAQNGRIGKLETWSEQHEKLNTFQYGELHEELAMQRQGVNREAG